MNILIYTYGNHRVGMGHVYRMLNLSSLLKERGHNTLFLIPGWAEGLKKIKEEKEKILKIPIDGFEKHSVYSKLLENYALDCIIVDGLNVCKKIMKLFRKKTKLLVSLDNTGQGRFFSDILINILYRGKPIPKIEINNFDYLILNKNFGKFNAKEKKIKKEVQRILITQGGSDTYGITPKIITELNKMPWKKIEYYILIGPAFKHFRELTSAIKNSNLKIKILKNIKKPWELFYKMDMAISAGGMTLFELLCLGVPCIVLTQEHKELETIEYLKNLNLIETLGLYEKIRKNDILNKIEELINNYDRRMEMSKNSKKAIDGKGGERVVNLIENYFNKIHKK